jgi:hypothetical protein
VRALRKPFTADLGVGSPGPRELGDLLFLRGQSGAGALTVGAYLFARGLELAAGALGKGVGAHGRKLIEGASQLRGSVGTTIVARQPFAVTQSCPRGLRNHAGAGKQFDGVWAR